MRGGGDSKAKKKEKIVRDFEAGARDTKEEDGAQGVTTTSMQWD